MYRAAIAAAAFLAFGCAGRRPPETYRLTRHDGGSVLIPPGVANARTTERSVKPEVPAGTGKCDSSRGIAIERRGRGIRIAVSRESLTGRPPDWLIRWASDAEHNGCIAAGSAAKLAGRVVESLPLDPAVAWRLLHRNDVRAGYMDPEPGHRIQVDSPIFREGAPPDTRAIDSYVVSGTDRSLNVDVKASPDLVGFERAWYAVAPRPGESGSTIEPLSAERHVKGTTEARPLPATNPFRFDRAAAWYRLLYRADRTIVVVGAARYSELERLSKEIDADPSACRALAGHSCVLIPSNVGVNVNIVVRVQGAERLLAVGATVGSAIRAAGAQPEKVLASLSVQWRYGDRLARMEFDRNANDILALRLSGGEVLAW